MSKNGALTLAGIVFAIIAIVHLYRIFQMIDITVGSYMIPMWVSWVAVILGFVLCILMFVARAKKY